MEFNNLDKKKKKLNRCDVSNFLNAEHSFKFFTSKIFITSFRRLKEVDVEFSHPITLITGTNRIGKTSILLLLACSHERFMRLDSSKPEPTWREHEWKDVLAFTRYETEKNDYSYKLEWRVGKNKLKGEGKRLATSRAWSGLGKRATDRKNAKIKEREVRLIDLERLLPARSFSWSLMRKVAKGTEIALNVDIAKAFCFVMEKEYSSDFEIAEVSGHVNKRCYLIKDPEVHYSSFSAATGEEALINLLRDVIEAPYGALILIDELEAGFHPTIQRRLADVICLISWVHKKQFVMTTHSGTLLDAFPPQSRKFLEFHSGKYRTISNISSQAALSKMDSIGHPLVRLYCEDDVAKFLISKALVSLSQKYRNFYSLFQISKSGPANMVKADFERHKFHYGQLNQMIGFCALVDGDMKKSAEFSDVANDNLFGFINPEEAPEKFLSKAYLSCNPNVELSSYISTENHHSVFEKMVDLGLATDSADARAQCYEAFKRSEGFSDHFDKLCDFLINVAKKFSDISI